MASALSICRVTTHVLPLISSALLHTCPVMPRAPAIALSHGGGPMPVLGDETHRDITASLSHRVPQILKLGTPEAPRAIVLVTAHWSTDRPTISSGKKHDLYYDYGGFPPASYQLKYDAPGSPEVAEEIRQAMEKEGLDPVLNERRGKSPRKEKVKKNEKRRK
ncbi:hypothetical protein VTK73DRAFT_1220 [Phialemonium thermophilum]|uniref:Extradiol ring-cleavage dioxygenase class III enzyme subunit B domain-containing protein n=1 Tax=Phialemonium thermophilum TaxID=223376 RepID=A0ABR3VTU2_9PEZI